MPNRRRNPQSLDELQAVITAYDTEINLASSYLNSGLSVLIRSNQRLVPYLALQIPQRSGRVAQILNRDETASQQGLSLQSDLRGRREELMAALQRMLATVSDETVVVIPQLDLLSSGDEVATGIGAGEVADILSETHGCTFLAFSDPSTDVRAALADRFAVQIVIDHLPRTVRLSDGNTVPVGQVLVTKAEADLFEGFNEVALYPHIAGMNAVLLRESMRFAYHNCTAADRDQPTFADLLQELRIFKLGKSKSFEVPTVSMNEIAGYQDIKRSIAMALHILSDAGQGTMPEHVRHGLAPKGFIFYGPPGTGKTMFAKAIASALTGTISVVSGLDVDGSVRRLRGLFAEARRCAPAVLVFDEFDAIASGPSGRDGTESRARSAIILQLLTELENFRPEIPVLTVGTTNRIDLIDGALIGRQRLQLIKIDLPDWQARHSIARIYGAEFGIEVSDALLEAIAFRTEGMSGDDIRSIFWEAQADELATGRPADAKRLGELIEELLERQRLAHAARTQLRIVRNPHAMNKKVFVSYVREDSAKVDRIAQTLRVYGIDPWLDRTHIAPGERWQRAIRNAIRDGHYFLACFSPAYAERDSTYMNEELRIAVEQLRLMPVTRRWFIPVMLESCRIPDFPIDAIDTLNSFQYIDFSNDWGAAMKRLIDAILSGGQPE